MFVRMGVRLLIFMAAAVDLSQAVDVVITREASGFNSYGELVDKNDKFTIQAPKCQNQGTDCRRMGGKRVDLSINCKCHCADDRAGLLWYTNNAWRCKENSNGRSSSGCNYWLNGKTWPQQLATLPVNRAEGIEISSLQRGSWRIYRNLAKYLTCDGRWLPLRTDFVANTFAIVQRNNSHFLKLHDSSPLVYSVLGSRIVSLAITSDAITWDYTKCVVFKVQGRLTCPEDRSEPLTSPTRQTTTASTTTQPSTTATQPPSVTTPKRVDADVVELPIIIPTTAATTSTGPTSAATTSTGPTSAANDMTTISANPTTNSSGEDAPPEAPGVRESGSEDREDRAGLIGGLVAGAVGFILMFGICIAVLMTKRRRRRKNGLVKNGSSSGDSSLNRSPFDENTLYAVVNKHNKAKERLGSRGSLVSSPVYDLPNNYFNFENFTFGRPVRHFESSELEPPPLTSACPEDCECKGDHDHDVSLADNKGDVPSNVTCSIQRSAVLKIPTNIDLDSRL